MKCRSDHEFVPYCHSPIACNAFGCCRERNINHGIPDDKTKKKWQKEDKET